MSLFNRKTNTNTFFNIADMFQAVETKDSILKYNLVSKKKNLLGIRNKKKFTFA